MSQYDSPPVSGNGYDPLPVTDPITTPDNRTSTSHDSGPSSTPEVAADQAKQVGHEALDGGRQVAQVAADGRPRSSGRPVRRRRTCSVRHVRS